jgi:hypothetical protein
MLGSFWLPFLSSIVAITNRNKQRVTESSDHGEKQKQKAATMTVAQGSTNEVGKRL